ncbi:MAG TPA: Ran-binding zinc finger domain-containing protein [Thermoanaerobaculia bacterium]|nr:Ran-binding zinc finger domain-containing protein [Thermoanaerobaculia bacterium]
MAVREGKWRCPYCSTVNRGRDLVCSGCGSTRDEDVKFFLEEEAPEVTDAALLAQARAGADWLCQFCETSNPPSATDCGNCGAEKGTSPSRPVLEIPAVPASPLPAAPPASPTSRKGGCGRWLLLGGLLLLLLLAGVCFLETRRTEEPVTVTGFGWERTVEVQAWRTVRDSAWEGEVPAGARVVSRSREVHHTEREQVGTERVKVGTRDLGNGFFEDVYEDRPVYEERPVHRDRVTYEVERWVPVRTERAQGSDRSPSWPALRLGAGEREAGRSERYYVLLQGEDAYRMELPQSRWSSFAEGQSLTAVVQGGDEVLELHGGGEVP